MKKLYIISLAIILLFGAELRAQDFDINVDSLAAAHFSVDSLSDDVIDRYDMKKRRRINDYSMIGFQYGVGMSRTLLQPEIAKEDMIFMPYNVGVLYTRYGKMFGYMPYFGFQAGLFFTQEGYKFRYDNKKQTVPVFLGAQSAVMDVVEVPLLAHCHADFYRIADILHNVLSFFLVYIHFLISLVRPVHSFFQNKSILKNKSQI